MKKIAELYHEGVRVLWEGLITFELKNSLLAGQV